MSRGASPSAVACVRSRTAAATIVAHRIATRRVDRRTRRVYHGRTRWRSARACPGTPPGGSGRRRTPARWIRLAASRGSRDPRGMLARLLPAVVVSLALVASACSDAPDTRPNDPLRLPALHAEPDPVAGGRIV